MRSRAKAQGATPGGDIQFFYFYLFIFFFFDTGPRESD